MATFLEPPPVLANPSQYQGWFDNRLDQSILSVPCQGGPLCTLELHLYPAPNGPATRTDWEFDSLFQSAAMVTGVNTPEQPKPDTWACVLPTAGIPPMANPARPPAWKVKGSIWRSPRFTPSSITIRTTGRPTAASA